MSVEVIEAFESPYAVWVRQSRYDSPLGVDVKITPIKAGARVQVATTKVRSFRVVPATPQAIAQGLSDAWCQVVGRIPVEIVGGTTAVLTLMTISPKDGSPGNRNCPPIRHPHVPSQSHDRWNLNRQGLGVPDLILGDHNVRLVGQDEYNCPPFTDDGEGLITGIEDKGSGHSIFPIYLG